VLSPRGKGLGACLRTPQGGWSALTGGA